MKLCWLTSRMVHNKQRFNADSGLQMQNYARTCEAAGGRGSTGASVPPLLLPVRLSAPCRRGGGTATGMPRLFCACCHVFVNL